MLAAAFFSEQPNHTAVGERDARDQGWVARIRVGDEQAFETLYRAYAESLRIFLSRSIGARDAAAEIVQDIFLAIWDHRTEWEVRGTVASYLFRAARNRA